MSATQGYHWWSSGCIPFRMRVLLRSQPSALDSSSWRICLVRVIVGKRAHTQGSSAWLNRERPPKMRCKRPNVAQPSTGKEIGNLWLWSSWEQLGGTRDAEQAWRNSGRSSSCVDSVSCMVGFSYPSSHVAAHHVMIMTCEPCMATFLLSYKPVTM